ncbi:hypothetical protein ACTXL8_14635 [Glutamicibacter arilaitensis]|uniref:hypothetical protein n=1 Tax=Glutamicibacter arilaitensis TaxID=256701 RepID=UPI003FD4FC3F
MSAEMVLCFAVRRMFWIHMPVIFLLLLASAVTAGIQSGFSGLSTIVAFSWVVLALGDWVTSELRANRLA